MHTLKVWRKTCTLHTSCNTVPTYSVHTYRPANDFRASVPMCLYIHIDTRTQLYIHAHTYIHIGLHRCEEVLPFWPVLHIWVPGPSTRDATAELCWESARARAIIAAFRHASSGSLTKGSMSSFGTWSLRVLQAVLAHTQIPRAGIRGPLVKQHA